MVTTGLVSLNVHDSLTFDGSEICLHPDLFSPGTTTTRNNNNSKDSSKGGLALTSTLSSDDRLSVTSGPVISVGDMIEIRVWDLLPNTNRGASSSSHASSQNVSSILRQRAASTASSVAQQQQQPTMSAASSSSSAVGNNNVAAENNNNNNGPQQQVSSSSSVNNNSMQYSEASDADADEAESKNVEEAPSKNDVVDASSVSSGGDAHEATPKPSPVSEATPPPPTKTVVTNAELPPLPVPTRNRSDDVGQRLTKPPLQRRATDSSKRTNTVQHKPRHVRDLSDMTADTATYATATPLDSSHQLLDFHLSMTGDNDEEDMWMNLTQTHSLRMSFIMLVTEKTLTSLKGSARTQVSILRQVADLYQLSSYDMVSVHVISKEEEAAALEEVSADFVVATIKDQFVSRGDMHFFQESLIGSWIYEGQRLHESSRGLQANAREIRHSERKALSGIVTDKTTITFRSRSARIIWLIQMSVEMWEYGTPYEQGQDYESLCEIYFDKWIAFVHKLFAKWKELEATHSLTVVFFSRSFSTSSASTIPSSQGQYDVYGRRYEDHFRIVMENETGPDWDSLIVRMKEAFVKYPTEVGWNLSTGESACRPSTASQGNVLEAINVTLNLLQYHYLDRDLQRTGNSIVVVSAGNGVFEVDKTLAGVTYQVSAEQLFKIKDLSVQRRLSLILL